MMVNSSAKSVRSARSGRFVSRPHDDPTEAPQKASANRHNKLDAVSSSTTTPSPLSSPNPFHYLPAQSTLTPDLISTGRTPNRELPLLTTTSTGRPPTHIHLQPNGILQQNTNGVITEVKLCNDDVAAVADASVAAFDNAITKEITKETTATPKEKDKRVLRSQGGSSRSKSSLARFFPDFDEIVFGASKEPEFLTIDSILFVVDTKSHKATTERSGTTASPKIDAAELENIEPVVMAEEPQPSRPAHPKHNPAEWPRVDAAALAAEADKYDADPLPDAVFLKVHKRSERKEKQLRNIEKEHALHEKSDLERLLAELKGPDWLRTMGISGITETEKKVFEPHRDQYIQRVKALLNKFTAWKEQEKELKLRREEALAAREDVDEDNAEDEEDEDHHNSEAMDASARQLLTEANSTSRGTPKIRLNFTKPLPPEPEPDKVFESFYSKPYLRAAALSNHRRGRSITAFGVPLPEMNIQEFSLPTDFISDEVITANARKRRRLKRESNVSEVK